MTKKWHLYKDGQQQGPFSSEELCQNNANGTIGPQDHIWAEGLNNWVKFGRFLELINEELSSSDKPEHEMGEQVREEHIAPADPEEKFEEIETPPPRALINFIIVYFEEVLKGIQNIRISQLLIIPIVFLIIFIFNLYLVVFVNNGFVVQPNRWYNPIMAVDGTKASVTIFWMLVIILFQSLISRVKSFGVSRFFKDQIESPIWLHHNITLAGDAWALPLLLWTSLTILASIFIVNPFTLLALSFIAFFTFNIQAKGVVYYILYLASLDWNYTFNKKRRYMNLAAISLGLFGLFLGLVISLFLPFKPISGYIIAGLLIALWVLLKTKTIRSSTAIGASFFFYCLLVLNTGIVLAHDGGFREAGSTIIGWLNSAGAWVAATMGTVPGMAGGLWSFITSIFNRTVKPAGTDFFQIPKLPNSPSTPVGPSFHDFLRTVRDIWNASREGGPRAANEAAAGALDNAWVPGLSEYMGPLRDSMLQDPGDWGRGSPGSHNDGGDTGPSRGPMTGDQIDEIMERFRREGY